MSVISGHPIFTGFRKLIGCQRDPRDRGVTDRINFFFFFGKFVFPPIYLGIIKK